MIKIEKVSVYGLEEAIRGMRNPWMLWCVHKLKMSW